MFSLIAVGIIAGLPATYELDFSPLPAGNARYYEFTVVLSFKGEPDTRIPIGIGRNHNPTLVADFFLEGMDERWKIKRDGNRITVLGYDDVKTARITVEGKGPQPLVRRVVTLPKPAKP
jgi:hypothetical protein